MRPFTYERAESAAGAAKAAAETPGARFLAGGTNLLDLMKLEIERPTHLIDVGRLPLSQIEATADGGLRIGAVVSNSDAASDRRVRTLYPVLSHALIAGASAQLRNKATIGGNLMQRTRCAYFRAPAVFPACNKRAPGSGCAAIGGATRNHAVLGTSAACIATYPGDLATALVAFDAVVHVGARTVPADAFFLAPGSTPEREHPLAPGELITAVSIPASPAARRSTYLKVRDRQSYEFAAASAAVGLELEADGRTIRDLRVALGGVATKPWRARAVEAALIGTALEAEAVRRASRLAMEGAVDHGANRFKIDLAPRVIARAVLTLGGMA